MAEELSTRELTLSQLVARASLRIGRKLSIAEGDELTKITGALALLNQAQIMVRIDARMARRLLEKANGAVA